MVRRLVLLSLALLLAFSSGAAAVTVHRTPRRPVLLALGDSLASGYQPRVGRSLPPVRASGFRDGGYPSGYAADLAARRGLDLVDLACPGETITSMVGRPANAACSSLYESEFGERSQLAAALRYLATDRGQVGLVTIDIGANDLTRCISGGTGVDLTCLAGALATLRNRLPAVLGRLRQALRSDDRGVRLAGMTYYDPFLALVADPGGPTATAEAAASLAGVKSLNVLLYGAYQHAGAVIADVSGAFSTDATLPFRRVGARLVPTDVAKICTLTWMCPTRRGVRPDIHPTTAGYAVIAASYERALG